MKRFLGIVALLGSAAGLAGAADAFARYQVILDRAPFGLSAPPTQTVAAVKNLRLSALMHMPDGPRAGFVDAQGKNDFVLRLNERSDRDVELLGVDYPSEKVIIRHEGQILMLGMQAGSQEMLTAAAAAMMLGGGETSFTSARSVPPPLPQNLSPELRLILGPPDHVPDPDSPEGRRARLQLQQLMNPAMPPEGAQLALPMPGGLDQPQVQSPEAALPAPDGGPQQPRRANRRGGFGL